MFLCPDGWHEWRAGDGLRYTPRQERVHCVMTYRERVTPIRAFPKLLHEALAEDAEFEIGEKSKITRLYTDEGEYAALIVVRGMFRGRPIAHIVSAVFADDFSTLLDARVEADYIDQYSQLVLELTKADRLELKVRRRRYGFIPPAGWHPIAGLGLELVLMPPNYPSLHASITMYPAQPLAAAPDPHELQSLHDERVGLGPAKEVRNLAMVGPVERELRGEEWRTTRELPNKQGKLVRYQVVLRDERYLYVAKLEAFECDELEALHRAFSETVGTIEPIPLPLAERSTNAKPTGMWSD